MPRFSPRRLSLLLVLVGLALATACAGGGGKPSANGPSELYLLSGQADLVQIALPGGQQKVLLHFNDASILDPAVSLDGRHIAFVKAPEYTTTTVDFGTDIYMADRDGANPTLLVKHVATSELLRYPAFVGDGSSLIFQVLGASSAGVPAAHIDKVSLTTHTREVLIDDGWTPSTSRDGQTIVYRTTNVAAGKDTLWSKSAAGGPAKPLVASTTKFGSFGYATFSPDNAQIAFGAATLSGAAPGFAPGVRPVSLALRPAETRARLNAVLTDGLPEDIWLVNADGGNLHRLASLAADLPSPAWSGDGKLLYVLDGNALTQLNVASGDRKKVAEGIFHGTIVWAPAPKG